MEIRQSVIPRQIHRQMHRQIHRQMHRHIHRQMHRQIHRQIYRQTGDAFCAKTQDACIMRVLMLNCYLKKRVEQVFEVRCVRRLRSRDLVMRTRHLDRFYYVDAGLFDASKVNCLQWLQLRTSSADGRPPRGPRPDRPLSMQRQQAITQAVYIEVRLYQKPNGLILVQASINTYALQVVRNSARRDRLYDRELQTRIVTDERDLRTAADYSRVERPAIDSLQARTDGKVIL